MTTLTNDELLKLYYYMVLTRKYEALLGKLFHEGKFDEIIHLSLGQEAVAVGATFCLRKEDILVPSLRSRGAWFVKGVDLKTMMAAVLVKRNAPNAGKETSHHMGIPELNIILTTGLIGSQIPLASGTALAAKMKKTNQVTICFFGDGAASRGDFHEGINFASVFKLPVVFICENNLYAWTTPRSLQMNVEDVASRASGYGIPGAVVDGQDVLQVYEAVKEAVERARKGLGPTLLECKTYRFCNHSELSPKWEDFREKEEIDFWKTRDPIQIMGKYLLDRGIFTEGLKAETDQKIDEEIKEALLYAENSPGTRPEDLYTNIYATSF
jgi:acetoin:2,6-dichlorophenolindophenol oxidoreductase subunit alpha